MEDGRDSPRLNRGDGICFSAAPGNGPGCRARSRERHDLFGTIVLGVCPMNKQSRAATTGVGASNLSSADVQISEHVATCPAPISAMHHVEGKLLAEGPR
jgi:hypothetical protein